MGLEAKETLVRGTKFFPSVSKCLILFQSPGSEIFSHGTKWDILGHFTPNGAHRLSAGHVHYRIRMYSLPNFSEFLPSPPQSRGRGWKKASGVIGPQFSPPGPQLARCNRSAPRRGRDCP